MKILCCVCIKYTQTSIEGPLGQVIEFEGNPYKAADHYIKLGHSFDDGKTYVNYTVIEYDKFLEEEQRAMWR